MCRGEREVCVEGRGRCVWRGEGGVCRGEREVCVERRPEVGMCVERLGGCLYLCTCI